VPSMPFLKRFQRWAKRSIRRRLFIWTTAFWIASISVLSLILILAGRATMTGEANQRNTQLASVISRDINAQISGISSDVRIFARYLETIPPDLATQVDAILALRLTSPQRYRAVYFFDDLAAPLFVLDDPVETLLSLNVSAVLARPLVAVPADVVAAYREVGSNTYLSHIAFTGIDRSPILYVGVPVRHGVQGSRVAVLQVDVTDVWQSIDLMTVGKSGIAYLVSPEGVIIAHPNRAYVGRPMPAELAPLLTSREGNAEYAEPFGRQPVLAAYSPVGGQTGWGTVVQQDRSEAYAAVSGTVGISVGVWSLLAAIGALGIMVSVRNFTRPIMKLTTTAQYIARTGEMARIGMSQDPDEVGQLSQAFDGMIGKLESAEGELREAHEDLEIRVIARTSELSDANDLLKNEIVQREQVEQALRDSELKYRHLVQGTTTMILEMDTEGRVTFFNRFAEEFFGFKESEIIGRSVVGTIVPHRDSAGTDMEAMIADVAHHPERHRHNENENVRSNGERVWVVWSNQPLYDERGELRKVLCVGIDMTEQKRAGEVLAAQAREQAAAVERTRLARDLHDAVSQTLFSASLIADVLPRIWERDEAEGRRRLDEVRQLTKGALAEMRTLLFELRPAALADADLSDLLRQLAESVTGRARVPVSTRLEGQCTLDADTRIALYRIAQEALNNVAKHSAATGAQVTLICGPGRVEMSVRDNGLGFDVSKVGAQSLGLGIMRERANAIGASLDVASVPGRGTQVVVLWQSSSEEKQL
jgi:PAS domain S-box-containing protein